MQRTHKAWMLAAAWLLSCLLATSAHAQSSTGQQTAKRPGTATQARRASSQRDLYATSSNRRSGRYLRQDPPAGAPAPAMQPGAEEMSGEMIAPGQPMMSGPDGSWSEGPYMGGYGGYDDCGCGGAGCGSGYGCGSGCSGYGCNTTCGYVRWWSNLSVSTGVQSFRGPVDFGLNSDFGFNQSANLSMQLFPEHCIGAQVGFRTTQTNLEGNVFGGESADRDQAFLTAGLFRRAGWLRGGAVIDILNDEYYANYDLNQIRAELSTMLSRGGEFGVWTAVSGDSDEAFLANGNFDVIWEPVDQYAFFYRRELCNGGNYRVWGGFTGHSDAIFGAEWLMPFSNRLAMSANFNYLIPEETSLQSYEQEAWNIGINFVWYPGGRSTCGDCGAGGLYDAMFRVADNGSFFINRRDRALVNGQF